MRTLHFVGLFLICGYSYGQLKIDSLRKLLRQSIIEKSSKDISYYFSLIGSEFLRSNKYDSAISYCRKATAFANNDHLLLKAASLNGIGVAYSFKGYTDSSIYYYKEALSIYKVLSDTNNVTNIDTNLSIIYKNKGLYEEALESAFAAVSKLEKRKIDKPLASCYSTIGSVYGNIKEYDLAIQFHRKALAVRLQLGYQKGIGQSYNNMGEIFLRWGVYDSALHNLQLAREIKIKNGENAPATINNIGEVLTKTNRSKEAKHYFEEALAIYEKTGDIIGQIVSLVQLGRLRISNNDLLNARTLLSRAEILSRRSGSLDYLKQVLEEKLSLYEKERNFQQAFLSSKELLQVKDSLLNKEKAEALSNMQIKYETDRKEQQIRLLQNEKDIQQLQLSANSRWVKSLVLVAILLIIILLLTLSFYRTSQRNKSKVELLLRELNHRVKNNLQLLSSLLSLQSGYLKDATAIQVVKSNEGRVNAMALIHKKLSINDPSQKVNMKEYLEELVHYLAHTYGYTDQNLLLDINVAGINLSVDKAIPIGLIVNELVTNSFKYAFHNQPEPSLKVTFQQIERNSVIEISDNGAAAESKIENTESFGLKMVNMLTKELKAQIKKVSNEGTSFVITVPNS